eukprot:5280346-Prymnesium_polylepis.1
MRLKKGTPVGVSMAFGYGSSGHWSTNALVPTLAISSMPSRFLSCLPSFLTPAAHAALRARTQRRGTGTG